MPGCPRGTSAHQAAPHASGASADITPYQPPRSWASLLNLKRHLDEINARPAAQRALALKDKHVFKTEMDEDARRHMFRHIGHKAA